MEPCSSKHEVAPVTGTAFQEPPAPWKAAGELFPQWGSPLLTLPSVTLNHPQFHPFKFTLVRFSPKRSHTHTAKATQKRFPGAKNGSQAHGCMCFHTQLETARRPRRNITLFQCTMTAYGDFPKDNIWEIKVNQPTPISYHEALTDLPKAVHFSRKLLYLSLGNLTKDVYLILLLSHPLPSILLPDSSSNRERATLHDKP